jgi:phosphoribosyl 1,2-cyclic phosphate phosphodiesterase
MRCLARHNLGLLLEPADDNRASSRMKATLLVLGSGTSMGVPTLGCECAVCRSGDPRDRRTRPSVMIQFGGKVVLIDTAPDFYAQAIRERITRVDAVFYTHTHADHILGIDDLRPLSFVHKPMKLPLYARPDAAAFLRKMFSYIFDSDYKYGSLPQLELRPIDGPVDLFGARFEPVRVLHGNSEIYGFRFGSAAYLTDHSEIPEASLHQLEGLDILFLDALRRKPHPTHSTVENSLRIVDRVKPKRAFFTHICHDLPHEATNATLPPHVRLSYDGLKLEFEI